VFPRRSSGLTRPFFATAWHDGPAPVPHAEMRPAGRPVDTESGADAFRRALTELQDALADLQDTRSELSFEQQPPPRRLAPFATAVAAAIGADDDTEIGGGRFVLLYDPAGQPGWDGRYRIIGYVRTELEPEMAADPLLNAVGWSWLTEALAERAAAYLNISGTVTTVVTQGFGAKQDEPTSTEFELRASWSPAAEPGAEPELAGHLAAWSDVLCAAAGLPPVPPGVAPLRPPRRRRRS
jgi:Protein of unknown function (DUF3000)